MKIKETVERLALKHHIDIDDLMAVYKDNLSREDMAAHLGISMFHMKRIIAELRLPLLKGQRGEGYAKLYAELSAKPNPKADDLEKAKAENVYLQHKLTVAERAIQRGRDDTNHLRKLTRETSREEFLRSDVLDLIAGALPIRTQLKTQFEVGKKSAGFSNYVSAILLSDLHVEEAVSRGDVGLANEFDWEIMEERLRKLFSAWFMSYRGEHKALVMLGGDFISGIIHDTLESTTKPTMEAIQDLSDIIAGYILNAGMLFKTVDVIAVGGNHERLSERIKSQSKGFDMAYIMYQLISAKIGSAKNIKMEISTTGHATNEIVSGVHVGLHHGDQYRGSGETRDMHVFEGFKTICGVEVMHIFQGHTHKFSYANTHRGAYITNGNLVGMNGYGVLCGFLKLRSSQTLIAFKPNGDIDSVRQVLLD